jgi:hypothetical protein
MKKMKLIPPLLPLVATGVLLSAFAPAQDLTETEKKAILDEIAKIEAKLTDGRAANNRRALKKFREASATPQGSLTYYLECVKKTDYDSKGLPESKWREWRDSQAEFKDSAFAKALQYQLRYLVLTVQAGMLEEDDTGGRARVMTQTVDFLKSMVGNYRDISNYKSVVDEGVMGSAYAEASRLRDSLDKPANWSDSPADIDDIYEKTVFPFYRESKNGTSLQNAWSARISQLITIEGTAEPVRITRRAQSGGRGAGGRGGGRNVGGRGNGGGAGKGIFAPEDRDQARERRKENAQEAEARLAEFRARRLPQLEWQMHRDAFLFGSSKSSAIRKLGSHLRSNLDHAAAPTWLEELKTLAAGDYDLSEYIGIKQDSEEKKEKK